MPHLSKKPLPEDVLKKVDDELVKTLLTRRHREADIRFLKEFFTKTERAMFAKRLAAMALLLKGMPPYHIQQKLKVSPSTLALLQLKLETKKLKRVQEVLSVSPRMRGFWEDLTKLFEEGFSQNSKRRSTWLHDNLPPD